MINFKKIDYLSEKLNPEKHQGHLGLWSHDKNTKEPKDLIKEFAPQFNHAIIFDTTQTHGMV